jgi:ArsR family transcriptional regulator
MTMVETVLKAVAGCCDTVTPRLAYDAAQQLSDNFAILAHPIRLQILDMLSQSEGHVCVCDLETALPVKQPTVSHHLRLLREAGLVEAERRGQWVYYSIQRPVLDAMRARMVEHLRVFG